MRSTISTVIITILCIINANKHVLSENISSAPQYWDGLSYSSMTVLFNTHNLTHTPRMCSLEDNVSEHILAEITLTIICSSRESIATMLSKYVLCEKKKWRIEMFDKWEALMTFTFKTWKLSCLKCSIFFNLNFLFNVLFNLGPDMRKD